MARKTIKEKILIELDKGTSIKKIMEKYNAKAQLYTALSEWIPKTIKEVPGLQQKKTQLLSDINNLEKDIKLKTDRNIELGNAIAQKNEALQKAQGDILKIEGETKARQEALENTEDLSAKGVSFDLIKRIHDMEFESGEDLITRITTVKAHEREKNIVAHLTKKRVHLKKSVDELKDTETGLDKKIKESRADFDALRVSSRHHGEAIKIVTAFFLDGYSVEDLHSLRTALNILRVKDKGKSLKRVVDSIEKEGLLYGLTNKIVEKREELETLEKNISKVKGKLNADITTVKSELKSLPDVINGAVEETKKRGIQFIKETATSASLEVNDVKQIAVKSINGVSNKALNALGKAQKITEETTDILGAQVEKSMNTIDVGTNRAMDNVESRVDKSMNDFDDYFAGKRSEIEEWGAMREWVGEYGSKIEQTQLLLGIVDDPDTISDLPPVMIIQL